ncbi:S8 family serine peptidase [Microvirga aerophila]|uniref:Peptidase S8/S53 domain-containing protein n=1 Tax=Microvirga aerophila TaxID=670291 RepID=A0A512C2F0_9HYPH|nr:S8 family serine peptidase [Microvirga aerophila]GEO18392.1 hypothetical protein MAE02_60880 [Microvirga aerophila]
MSSPAPASASPTQPSQGKAIAPDEQTPSLAQAPSPAPAPSHASIKTEAVQALLGKALGELRELSTKAIKSAAVPGAPTSPTPASQDVAATPDQQTPSQDVAATPDQQTPSQDVAAAPDQQTPSQDVAATPNQQTPSPVQAAAPAPASTSPTPTGQDVATASDQQTSSLAQAAPQAPATSQVSAQPPAAQTNAVGLAEPVDPRPKPRQSTDFIVASGLSRADLTRLTAQGFRIETQTQGRIAPQVVRLRVPQGASLAQAQQTIRLVDAQASADFDHFYYLDEGAGPCTGPECTATALVNWSASNVAQCGPTPLIGLIDTGINLNHDALKDQAIEVVEGPASRADASLQDHGTAVAALLVGRRGSQTPGLLPDAKLVAVDAFYRDGGTADRTDVMSLVAAVEALAERGVQVMNLSLSGPPNTVLKKAIEAAQAKGIVIIAAAGNNGAGAEPSYPAAYPGVIAVTAVDQELKVYRRATHGAYVDLAAPGVNIWTASSQGSGALRTGTSYAVPFVSAAAGLLLASNPGLDPKVIQSRLEARTRDLGEPGWDPTYGFGLIQVAGLCAGPAEPAPVTAAYKQPTVLPVVGQTSDMP